MSDHPIAAGRPDDAHLLGPTGGPGAVATSPKREGALPTSSPSVQGVEAEGVQALLDALELAQGVEPHSLVVVRHGYVVAAGWWHPYTPERDQLVYSVSKSFTATAAGLAAGEGLLDFDRPVVSYFPELDREVTDPRSRAMLVRHIASMASGHANETWPRVLAEDPAEPVRAFLRLPPDQDPGTIFAYNQSCTYTLATIVQKATGMPLSQYLKRKLPAVFAGTELRWQKDALGRELGFTGLHTTTEALARLGLLYLQGGKWEGEQVLSPAWVPEATKAHVPTALAGMGDGGSDWAQGYGYQFWASRHGYRADGAYGQFCLVLPEHDAVVAITSQSPHMQNVLDAVWENLLPALLDGPVTESGADARLRERLAGLSVPALDVQPSPPAGGQQVWAGATFAPEGGKCDEQPSLTAVTVSTDQGGWLLALQEGPRSLDVRLGTETWLVTEPDGVPVACLGGWESPESLRADIIFLETPHRLAITCAIASKTFSAAWATRPLHAPSLKDLRAPVQP
jgi:CubicO group peptidase (beta-lactamase class C family)